MVKDDRSYTKQLVDNIMELPNAAIILNEVSIKLEEERKKRAKFYNDITEQEKAEFINGEIIIHSPVKMEHNDATGSLYKLISVFNDKNKLGYVGYEKIMISLTRNDYEPDICFFDKSKSVKFKKGQSLFPAPDLIVEVLSKSTTKNDRGIKFEDYQAHQVLEYWIIDPLKSMVEQYRLNTKGTYELILKAKKGTLESKAIKGFTIPIESIFDENINLETLEKILNTSA